jgi:hypothetical protein
VDLLISKELSTLFGFKMSKITPCTVDPGFQGLPPAILRWSRRGHSRRRHRREQSRVARKSSFIFKASNLEELIGKFDEVFAEGLKAGGARG